MLPKPYAGLARETGPKMLVGAVSFYGLHEAPGAKDNPIILGWANELGLSGYRSDDIAWCGLFMAKIAHDAGKSVTFAPLWAKNWSYFGVSSPVPMLGDVLVFNRPGGGGHVGLYVGEDPDAYHVLGGNEGDAVAIIRIARIRLFAARRPIYQTQPANVRVIQMGPDGPLSHNES